MRRKPLSNKPNVATLSKATRSEPKPVQLPDLSDGCGAKLGNLHTGLPALVPLELHFQVDENKKELSSVSAD